MKVLSHKSFFRPFLVRTWSRTFPTSGRRISTTCSPCASASPSSSGNLPPGKQVARDVTNKVRVCVLQPGVSGATCADTLAGSGRFDVTCILYNSGTGQNSPHSFLLCSDSHTREFQQVLKGWVADGLVRPWDGFLLDIDFKTPAGRTHVVQLNNRRASVALASSSVPRRTRTELKKGSEFQLIGAPGESGAPLRLYKPEKPLDMGSSSTEDLVWQILRKPTDFAIVEKVRIFM